MLASAARHSFTGPRETRVVSKNSAISAPKACARRSKTKQSSPIFPAALKPTHIGPVDPGIHRQRLLRQLAADPQTAKISGYCDLRPHTQKQAAQGRLNHGP